MDPLARLDLETDALDHSAHLASLEVKILSQKPILIMSSHCDPKINLRKKSTKRFIWIFRSLNFLNFLRSANF